MITTATAKGRREYQEDRSFTFETPEVIVLGVFDGHGGTKCAEHCVAKMPNIIAYWLANEDDLTLVLKESFAKVNADTFQMYDGAAASVVIIDKEHMQAVVAILGDSPVLIKTSDSDVWVSPEHNVRSNMAEADAAIKLGGIVHGGYLSKTYYGSGLQMSRAFGDSALHSVLNREPEIFTLNLNKISWVLVATDGAFDPAHTDAKAKGYVAEQITRGLLPDAQAVVDRAIAARTGDNVTAILWRP